VKRDTDYVALVRGKLSVALRQEVAEVVAAGARDHAELESREGVEGGLAGIGAVETLKSRPQLSVSAGATGSIKDAPAGGEGGWDVDAAAAAIAEAIAAAGGGDGSSSVIADQVYDDIAEGIIDGIQDQITLDVLHTTLAPPFELGGPPGPPGP
jgi:hypothetical protein